MELWSQVLNQNIVQKFVSYLKHYILNFTLVDGQSPLWPSNSSWENKAVIEAIKCSSSPGDYWQIDFTGLPCKENCKYLLVLVDPFSGWPEEFPCCTNLAKEIVKILLNQIFLCFGAPLGMSSDRESHFIAGTVGQGSKALGIQRDLHTLCQPQASGKVRRMNYAIKLKLLSPTRTKLRKKNE